MKKLLVLLFILFFSFASSVDVWAFTLKGHVVYQNKEIKEALTHVNEARTEAFENVQNSIDISTHQKHFKDPFHRANQRLGTYTSGDFSRFITHYSDESYCICYEDEPEIWYHYNKKGKLEYIEYYKNSNISYKYNLEGKLETIDIKKFNIGYIFNTNGNLIAFWINSIGYTPDGKIYIKRL